MEIRHLTQRELAERWSISEVTFEFWRSEELGPNYLKLRGRGLCRLVDVEACEESCLRATASS